MFQVSLLSLLVPGIIMRRWICHWFLARLQNVSLTRENVSSCILVFSHFIHFLMFIPIMALLLSLSLSMSWWSSSFGCCDWHSRQLHHHQQQLTTPGSGSGSHPLGRSRSIVANPARQSSGRRSQSFLSSLIHFSEKIVTCGALAYYLYSMVTLFRVTWCRQKTYFGRLFINFCSIHLSNYWLSFSDEICVSNICSSHS